ncbi:MAG TPA: hypothetical protein VMT04_02595 [Terriglobales bacterium]|nr:hypothetical protein [Terriglobales bacterium]
MPSFKKVIFLSFLFVSFFVVSSVLSQTTANTPQIKEMSRPGLEGLREFHEVLQPVWHTAYAEKDYQAIRDAVPQFKKEMEVIEKAELSGFYREKKGDYEKKREVLAEAVLDLEEKSKGTDDEALLKATENLHTAYEQLVRVFAPRVTELESFHLALYPLWHEALPNKDYKAIKASTPALQEKMAALMKVELPEKSKSIAPQFIEKRKAFNASVDALVKACNGKDNKKIEEKLDKMHAAYQELNAVFEAE